MIEVGRQIVPAFFVAKNLDTLPRSHSTDSHQRYLDLEAAREADHIRRILHEGAEHEEAEMLEKSRTKDEWAQVKRRKQVEYGKEIYADPTHDSYPLTVSGKPSKKETLAAWRYISAKRDSSKYTPEQLERVRGRIKRFTKQHFGLELESAEETKKAFTVVFPIAK